MKTNILYHGTSKKIKGNFLIPNKPQDLEIPIEKIKKGVYATPIKNNAIAMAIISSKGVISGSLNFEKNKKAIIYEGWPKQKYVYLYSFLSEGFIKKSKKSSEWISKDKVRIINLKKLKIKSYLNLIRKATDKEIKGFFKKHNIIP
ncbi:MAG: hypothetical protein AABX54_01295 [Nanoarchaeota archaeon]